MSSVDNKEESRWIGARLLRRLRSLVLRDSGRREPFDYKAYWQVRYERGETSGVGSHGDLANYKADTINQFMSNNHVESVIEFGCGDGNQISLTDYRRYTGLDVATSAVELCRRRFADDTSKTFLPYEPGVTLRDNPLTADLVICLDVLYHITDEDDFRATLTDILTSASKYVILYTNVDSGGGVSQHIVWRDTRSYLAEYPEFEIDRIDEQPYPDVSDAKFIFLSRR